MSVSSFKRLQVIRNYRFNNLLRQKQRIQQVNNIKNLNALNKKKTLTVKFCHLTDLDHLNIKCNAKCGEIIKKCRHYCNQPFKHEGPN